ncbi:9315_t:CDS:2 [Ambispora leptoticha]|uniref:Mannosyltransferase n=1 Tax=Ambispora leptoticha TaxID=144679 RepID=A0A9N9FA31_9GLOM|nr:9315_t:CDS:2 [Ambispora leptoticha]
MDKYDMALAALVTFYVVYCPFTKVEESFNLQATHDVLEHGVALGALKKYDHFEFPGVVPRTFVGPLVLGGASWPFVKAIRLLYPNVDKLIFQYIVRVILGLFSVYTLSRLRLSIRTSFGLSVSVAFALLSALQFHTTFWSSRTLPNMFAFPLTNIAFSHWILSLTSSNPSSHILSMLRYFTFTTVVFRFEVFLLAGPIVLLELIRKNVNFYDAFKVAAFTGVFSLGISLIIDSYFWQKNWMWPEGYVFYFNAILGKSVEWGVLPFHTYFTSFLPRLLLTSLPLSIYAAFVDRRARMFLSPIFLYILIFSFLGHKEWRFIVYVVPIFNLCAAVGWIWIEQRVAKVPYNILRIITYACLAGSCFACIFMVYASSCNYPGGYALRRIHVIERNVPQVKLHLDVYTAMTGASRFGQLRDDWTYSKNESHSDPSDYIIYSHLLTSDPQTHEKNFESLEVIDGYSRAKVRNFVELTKNWVNFFKGTATATDGTSLANDNKAGKKVATISSLSPVEIMTVSKVWIMRKRS